VDDKSRQSGEFKVNEQFAGDLKKLYGPKGHVPARVDMGVLGAAGGKLVRKAPGRLRWVGAGVAAAILLLVMLNLQQGGTKQAPTAPTSMAQVSLQRNAEDINGDGRVDMLDALRVARAIEAGRVDMKLDLNGDGVVDKRDVDAVAMTAVKLGKGA